METFATAAALVLAATVALAAIAALAEALVEALAATVALAEAGSEEAALAEASVGVAAAVPVKAAAVAAGVTTNQCTAPILFGWEEYKRSLAMQSSFVRKLIE